MAVASACTKSIPCASKVGASGNVMSHGLRLPKGSQISDGLNKNVSDADTTLTSTSPCNSWLTASAAVSPPKLPPSTSTLLRPMTATSLQVSCPFTQLQNTHGGIREGEAQVPFRSALGPLFVTR